MVLTTRGRYREKALGTAWPSEMNGGGYRGSMWADDDMGVDVVGGQDSELEGGPGFCPAKPITECDATCIRLVWRLLSRIVYRVHEVRRKRWWWWWNARKGRSGGGGV